MSLCLASQVWPGLAVLVPIPGPEQPTFFLGTRVVDQSLRGVDTARGFVWRPARICRAEISQNLGASALHPWHSPYRNAVPCGATALLGRPTTCSIELPERA